ncbi:MAG TPA: DUF5808 domain-containing protein [Chloroflexota bacterium]
MEIEFGGVEIEVKGLRGVATLLGLALVAAAVARELSLPPAERTWHGRLLGVVPYDFRLPTRERLRAAYWDPENPRLLTAQPFGVGWTLNLARLARLVGIS